MLGRRHGAAKSRPGDPRAGGVRKMRRNIWTAAAFAALAMAISFQANTSIPSTGGFEGAGITAKGKRVVVAAPALGHATKGFIIVGGKVISLKCAMFVPARGSTGAPKPTG